MQSASERKTGDQTCPKQLRRLRRHRPRPLNRPPLERQDNAINNFFQRLKQQKKFSEHAQSSKLLAQTFIHFESVYEGVDLRVGGEAGVEEDVEGGKSMPAKEKNPCNKRRR